MPKNVCLCVLLVKPTHTRSFVVFVQLFADRRILWTWTHQRGLRFTAKGGFFGGVALVLLGY